MEKLISTYTNHNHLNDGSIPEADFSPRCIQSKSQPLDYLNRSESWDTNVDCFTNCKHVFPALTKATTDRNRTRSQVWQSWMFYGRHPPRSPHLPATLSAKETRHRQKIEWTLVCMGMTFIPVWLLGNVLDYLELEHIQHTNSYISGEENAYHVIEQYIWNVWRRRVCSSRQKQRITRDTEQSNITMSVRQTEWMTCLLQFQVQVYAMLTCHTIMANWELNRAPLFLWHY